MLVRAHEVPLEPLLGVYRGCAGSAPQMASIFIQAADVSLCSQQRCLIQLACACVTGAVRMQNYCGIYQNTGAVLEVFWV